MSKQIQTLLIANRGEIAVRIIRTARKMGIRTVAVFSEADRNALHVAMADSRFFIGAGPVNQTYLNRDKILDALQRTGATAVHPGYGFLSEDADFADQVMSAGFIWVGPPVSAMQAMASKAAAKQTLAPKGVPMVPGYHGDDQRDKTLMAEAASIGFPLLVKASAGGGGKGMKIVEQMADLLDALASARREAKNSFGDDRLLLEKYLIKPRHVEVQIMADQHGRVLSLFERDCSVQRRHQKVMEEAPAPLLDESIRKAMWLAAETTAREIGYQGAGTVEFILSADGEFFFLEMNTRLQVEHPVTEYITGLDLVEWQLRVAAGEPLSIERPEKPIGHAIEVRLYAEDPAQQFQPMIGCIDQLYFPIGDGIRVDSGVESGAEVTPFYDPMLAKLIVHGSNRSEAIRKLKRVLAETRCIGLTTNLGFLRQLVARPEILDMTVHTRWLDEASAFYQSKELDSLPLWAALAQSAASQTYSRESENSWQRHAGWRMGGHAYWRCRVDEQSTVELQSTQNQWQLSLSGQSLQVDNVQWQVTSKTSGRLVGECEGLSIDWDAYFVGDQVWLDNGDRIEHVTWWTAAKAHDHEVEKVGKVSALLPGVVTAVYVIEGADVQAGDKLISYEAMKMETTQTAEVSGKLKSLRWIVGDQIAEGDLLYEIESDEVAP